MTIFSDCKRFPSALLALTLTASSSLCAIADAPPGAYLQATTKTQKPLAGTAQKSQAQPAAAPTNSSSGSKYGQPLSDSLDSPPSNSQSSFNSVQTNQPVNQPYAAQPPQQQQNWDPQQNMGWQGAPQGQPMMQGGQPQPGSQQYNGFAQQSAFSAPPPNYPPQQQSYPSQPPANMNGGGNWQADYPSMSEMNAPQQQVPQGAQYGGPPQFGQPLYAATPPTMPAIAPPGQNQVATKPAAEPDDTAAKTLNAIANTVLPIATTMVTNAIMNKMMYGTMTPGYGNMGYPNNRYGSNPYGANGNPMGGYGYNRPNLLNGIMGGGNGGLGGLLNTH